MNLSEFHGRASAYLIIEAAVPTEFRHDARGVFACVVKLQKSIYYSKNLVTSYSNLAILAPLNLLSVL
jgi:hypothetical protein